MLDDKIATAYTNPDSLKDTALSIWLDTVLTKPLAHWGIIALGQQLLGSHTQLGHTLTGTIGVKSNSVLSLIEAATFDPISLAEGTLSKITPNAVTSMMVKSAEIMNYLYDILRDPNIEGIPIHTATLSVSREVDVSENPVIMQKDAQRAYVQDNAVPRPRKWNLDGYLMATNKMIDGFSVVKPTLIAQQKFLDFIARSRRPVWFKDHNCEFHLILITSIHMESTATTNTGVHVTLQLSEYTPLQVTTNSFSDILSMYALDQEGGAIVDMANMVRGAL